MRQRLQGCLPILLIALMVQILAPIGAAWSVASAASDPLRFAEICHAASDSSSSQDDNGSGQHAHEACVLCCVAQAAATLDAPQPAMIAAPTLAARRIVWHATALVRTVSRTGSNAKARAPPLAA
jgi:hypothetical protein